MVVRRRNPRVDIRRLPDRTGHNRQLGSPFTLRREEKKKKVEVEYILKP